MVKVIITDEKLPKVYERPILEEYYCFFKKLGWSTGSIFPRKVRFTTLTDRLTKMDEMDECLMASINTYKSIENSDIRFVLFIDEYNEHDNILALARIKEKENDIHVAEILFLDYPNKEEKQNIIDKILIFIEEYARYYDISKVTCEIPKYDNLYLNVVNNKGYSSVEENERVKALSQTFLLEKKIKLTRDENEWTRNRKQRKESN